MAQSVYGMQKLVGRQCGAFSAKFSPDGHRIVTTHRDAITCTWTRRRPEYWWGLAWLPEFWMTVFFAGALMWSAWRDIRDGQDGRH